VIDNARNFLSSGADDAVSVDYLGLPLRRAREEFEKRYIMGVLKKFNGDLRKAASFMEIDISNLYRKINKYRLTP